MSVQIHPRYFIVTKAECELTETLVAFGQKHDLTAVEMIGILLSMASNWHRRVLRRERHPKDRTGLKKADEL